jgi:hypothetical protein
MYRFADRLTVRLAFIGSPDTHLNALRRNASHLRMGGRLGGFLAPMDATDAGALARQPR